VQGHPALPETPGGLVPTSPACTPLARHQGVSGKETAMTLALLLCLVIVRGLLCVARHWPTLQPVVVVVLIGGVVFYLLSLVVVPARDRRGLPPRPSGVCEAVQLPPHGGSEPPWG
jgi:hypothetical protein